MKHNNLGEALATYLYRQPDLCDLEPQIDALPDNGTAQFRATEPQLLLSVMLAAHDEPTTQIGSLLPLLQERVHDQDMPPASVIISCNAPQGTQETTLYRQNIATIRDFQESTHRDDGLAVSYFEIAYPEGTVQGKRRKDLGDVAMLHAWRTYSIRNTFPDKMSHMMIDVDTPHIRQGSFTKLHQSILRGQRVVAPRTTHQKDPAYPNLAKALVAHDVLYNLIPSAAWDAYMMFDLQTLADGGGYVDNVNANEVHETSKRCLQSAKPYIHIERQARFTTDARRIQEQLLAGKKTVHECWPSFSETESYRLTAAASDISQEQLHDVIRGEIAFTATSGLKSMVRHRVQNKISRPVAFSQSLWKLAQHLRVANILFDLELAGRQDYEAIQEAAQKYRIV